MLRKTRTCDSPARLAIVAGAVKRRPAKESTAGIFFCGRAKKALAAILPPQPRKQSVSDGFFVV
jgi:hypothetical protein